MAPALTAFITDAHHAVPTLRLLVGLDCAAARERALAELQENPHYLKVEVCEGDLLLFAVGRPDLAPATADNRLG